MSSCHKTIFCLAFSLAFLASAVLAQAQVPVWCAAPPGLNTSAEYKSLKRVSPGVFAIHEPRQSQSAISYLIVGDRQALLFDTGMGIGDLRKVTGELTKLPVVQSEVAPDQICGELPPAGSGKIGYKVEGISFLMAATESKP